MAVASPVRRSTGLLIGGALVALAGLLQLVQLLSGGGGPSLVLPVDLALVLGSVALALGPQGVVGASRPARVALIVFGAGPLLFGVPVPLGPWSVPLGMSSLVLVTVATVVATMTVARRAVLRGVARWVLVVVAADAVFTLAMSSVELGPLSTGYLGWHLELVRPLGLLVWGLSIVWQSRASAIRQRIATISSAWKRSTDVGDAATEATVDGPARR